MAAKYIFVNGIPQKNPDYRDDSQAPPPPYVATKLAAAMPIVSTMEDQVAMAEGTGLAVPQLAIDAMNRFQGQQYVDKFQSSAVTGESLLTGLTNLFQRLSIPFGFIDKVMGLQNAWMHFKVDDSESMNRSSGLTLQYACAYMQQKLVAQGHSERHTLTRWEEAQDRLHSYVELLAYVPTGDIKLSFFDHPNDGVVGAECIISRQGRSPEEFIAYAHAEIDQFFNRPKPYAGTPILSNLQNMVTYANALRGAGDTRMMNYMLSDGEPNGGRDEVRLIKNFLRSINTGVNTITFLGCSNDRSHYDWMHEMETLHPEGGVSALADYPDELVDVLKDQGQTFPYSRGIWLICSLAAAINPNDLDCLDHGAPLTKPIMENLWARGMPDAEYQQYFMNHPGAAAQAFGPDYQQFLTCMNANQIASVKTYNDAVIQYLSRDIDAGEDDSENRADYYGKQAVMQWRSRMQPVYTVSNLSTMFQPPSNQPAQYQPPPPQPSSCCTIL